MRKRFLTVPLLCGLYEYCHTFAAAEEQTFSFLFEPITGSTGDTNSDAPAALPNYPSVREVLSQNEVQEKKVTAQYVETELSRHGWGSVSMDTLDSGIYYTFPMTAISSMTICASLSQLPCDIPCAVPLGKAIALLSFWITSL